MTDDEFKPLPDHALARQSDEALLAYIASAGRAGLEHETTRGQFHLLERHMGIVKARLRLRVPDHLLDDMTHDVLVEAVEAALAGKPIANFRAWLNQVIANTRAEFYRGKQYRQLQQDREAAVRERDDDEGGVSAPPEEGVEGGYGALELELLIEQLLDQRSAAHRTVIDLYVFDGLSAKETAGATGESENNVYKIAERFRTELRQLLEDDDAGQGSASPDGDTGGGP